MPELTISSWNINGIRAAIKTGDFQGWLAATRPHVAGLQEVKATPGQVDPAHWESLGYTAWWHPAERPGYSGALLLSRVPPVGVRLGLGHPEYDREGRVIQADFGDFVVITSYFPNGGKGPGERLDFKLAFFRAFLDHIDALRATGRKVVFMGDLNVAHREIDLARPAEGARGTGFLPVERAWIDEFIAHGFVDAFRALHPDARDVYTYWDAWRERRARNIGWRIDYVFVSDDLVPSLSGAVVESSIMGSDHCPVGVTLSLPGGS